MRSSPLDDFENSRNFCNAEGKPLLPLSEYAYESFDLLSNDDAKAF